MNNSSSLANNAAVRLIPEIPLDDANNCVVWRQNSTNPAVDLFVEMLDSWFPMEQEQQ